MANYLNQACWAMQQLTDAEQSWLSYQCEEVDYRDDDDDTFKVPRVLVDYPELESEDPYLGFHWHTNTNQHGVCLIIEDDGGTLIVDKLAYFLQMFLRAFPARRYALFQWANICDQARCDAFGGGALFITAEGVKWMSTEHWLVMQEQEFLAEWEAKANLIPGDS